MPLTLNVIQKKFCVLQKKSSVFWAEPHSRSSAEQFGRTERSVDHYFGNYLNFFLSIFQDFILTYFYFRPSIIASVLSIYAVSFRPRIFFPQAYLYLPINPMSSSDCFCLKKFQLKLSGSLKHQIYTYKKTVPF